MSNDNNWKGLPARELFVAARDKKLDRLKETLQRKKDRVNDLDKDRWGLLHYLCADSSTDTAYIDLLVEHKANVNIRNGFQETPLIIAVMYDNQHCAERMLFHGAHPECTDWSGMTALSRAKEGVGSGGSGLLRLIQDALSNQNQTTATKIRENKAEELRQKGNQAWGLGDVPKALELYTKSLNAKEDYRTLSNRAACWVRMEEWKKAIQDASRASVLEPTFAKAWLRKIKVYIRMRDFPRARMTVLEALKCCPDSRQLSAIRSILSDLAVPDRISNPLSRSYSEAVALLKQGAACTNCPYCLHQIPVPLMDNCPRCACDPRNTVDENKVAEMASLCDVAQPPPAQPDPKAGSNAHKDQHVERTQKESPPARTDHAANLARKDNSSGADLNLSAWNGDYESIRRLHAGNASLTAPNDKGFHAAFQAASSGDETVLRLLVELGGPEGAGLLQATVAPTPGFLPSHGAANNGHTKIVFVLSELGAGTTLSRPCNGGSTPAHLAACEGYADVIKALAACGAGKSLSTGCWNGSLPMHRAAAQGHDSAIQALFDAGASKVCKGDKGGNTPLHAACRFGHASTMRLLCKLGATPVVSQPNVQGCHPVHLAAVGGFDACLLLLGELGADMSACNSQGFTPAVLAAASGHVQVLRALHSMPSADISCPSTPLGWTGAHLAAQNGQPAVLRAFHELGKGHVLSQTDAEQGMMPAHAAAKGQQPECIRELHRLGAPLSAPNRYRRTPAHFAAMNGDKQSLAALVDSGAGESMLARDVLALSPVQYACDKGLQAWLVRECKNTWSGESWSSRCLEQAEGFVSLDAFKSGTVDPKQVEEDALVDMVSLEFADGLKGIGEQLQPGAMVGAGGWKAHVRVCAQCGANDAEEERQLLQCPCQAVAYCGRDCQLAHWKQHKKLCTARKPK